MEHSYLVTAKVRTRYPIPKQSLREVQLIEDIYGQHPTMYGPTDVLVYNNTIPHNIYFPLEGTRKYIKK